MDHKNIDSFGFHKIACHCYIIFHSVRERKQTKKGQNLYLNLPGKGFDHKMTLTFTGSIIYRQLLVHVSI